MFYTYVVHMNYILICVFHDRDMFGVVSSSDQKPKDIEDRKRKFLFYLNSSGKYYAIKENLKVQSCAYVHLYMHTLNMQYFYIFTSASVTYFYLPYYSHVQYIHNTYVHTYVLTYCTCVLYVNTVHTYICAYVYVHIQECVCMMYSNQTEHQVRVVCQAFLFTSKQCSL